MKIFQVNKKMIEDHSQIIKENIRDYMLIMKQKEKENFIMFDIYRKKQIVDGAISNSNPTSNLQIKNRIK